MGKVWDRLQNILYAQSRSGLQFPIGQQPASSDRVRFGNVSKVLGTLLHFDLPGCFYRQATGKLTQCLNPF